MDLWAVELARHEYTQGTADFQVVLDSERAVAQLEDELAQTDAGGGASVRCPAKGDGTVGLSRGFETLALDELLARRGSELLI